MEVYTRLKDSRQFLMENGDPRVESWLMMSDPLYPLVAVLLYFAMVIFLPKYMETRKAFDLKWLLVPYNIGLVILCGYMAWEMAYVAYLSGYSLSCQPVDYSNHPLALRMLAGTWWFYFSKIIELADTLFFILRKKNDQVSFLHVYHHSTMPLLIWAGCKYIGGGQVFMVGIANSLVHVVMYSYYGMSAMGPHMHKYLWWKKHLTKMQLCHFFTIMIHVTMNLVQSECDYPSLPNWTIIVYTNSQVVLFSNFYYQAYVKRRRDIQKKESAKKHENGVSNGVSNGIPNGTDLRKRPTNGHLANGSVKPQ